MKKKRGPLSAYKFEVVGVVKGNAEYSKFVFLDYPVSQPVGKVMMIYLGAYTTFHRQPVFLLVEEAPVFPPSSEPMRDALCKACTGGQKSYRRIGLYLGPRIHERKNWSMADIFSSDEAGRDRAVRLITPYACDCGPW